MPAIGATFGPYRIIAPLGAGGMGEVYRAHDARLRRDVALKVLPAHRSRDPEFVARMVREARLAASVEHPGVVAVHDVGEQDGHFYLVTELVEGVTLRDRLRRGPLPVREVAEIGTAIASALSAAHARGVVHRDLKPENIMTTTAGVVKVLDFGVAKFVAPADGETEVPHTVLTEPGASVGTPAYMSPEQLEGRHVDHRADQFALGVMLHEMLAGRRPFGGSSAAEVSASILRDEPESLEALGVEVPPPVSWLIRRCLSKNPEQRYASTTDLAHGLADIRSDVTTPSRMAKSASASNRGPIAIAAVMTVAAITATVVGLPRREQPPPAADATGARAIAVLPFAWIGEGDGYLADGLTEAVTRELGHVDGTRVIAPNSAFAYKGRTEAVGQIGRDLGADVLVRGSVQRAGDRVRINASLVDASTGTALWSSTYNRSATDLFTVQDDIAWQVAAKLASTVGAAVPPRPASTPMTSPEAYDAYLRGIGIMRGPSSGFAGGITHLERAVELDPNFALAHARLASAYTQQLFYNTTDPQLERNAFLEIEKALAINSDLAEAYLARAQLTWNLRNGFPHERAIADLRRAIALNPNLAVAHVELAKLYYHVGLLDRAIAANEEGLRLDPGAPSRILAAKIDGGMTDWVRDTLSRSSQMPLRSRAEALSFLGRTDDAIAAIAPNGVSREHLEKIDMNNVALLAQLLARKGRRADAERTLQVAIPLAANPTGLSDTHHAQFSIGCAHALLGDRVRAVEWLTKAANEGYPSYPRFSSDPDLNGLKGDAAFESLMARLKSDFERWSRTL